MSVSHGRPRKSSNQNAATGNSQKKINSNAVYPILRPAQKNSVPDVANGVNGVQYSRGQCIHPKPAIQPRIVTSVAEFVSEVMPQTSHQVQAQNEPIQWVRIEKCVIDGQRLKNTFVVIIGLTRGYQIWIMLENGDCEELVSERCGPLRIAHLLPFVTTKEDKFKEDRPLLALVDGNPMAPDNKICSVNFLSLKLGKIVHSLKFDNPVIDLNSSDNAFLVIFSESIIVCDQNTLTERCCVMVPPSSDPTYPPVYSISDCFLAFVDCSLNPSIQSCGGHVNEEDQSYSGQVMNAAKSISKTMTSIGETLVSSFSTPPQEKRNNRISDPGVVSVISMNMLPETNNKRPGTSHYVAHFTAQQSGVGYLAFGNGGRLLFSSNETATTFNLYLLHPHPLACRLGSVQHIYTLYRGNSSAKLSDTAFSSDNRWLAVATNHGTTHVYAITPYGGPVCMRTHGGKFVNRESRFERTAGLSSDNQVSFSVHTKQHASSNFKEHPALTNNGLTARTVVNPRLTRYPPPIVLWSYAKIKQKMFSAENLSAWASDNAPVSLSGTSGRSPQLANGHPMMFESHRRLALCFDTVYGEKCAPAETPVLFVMSADGTLSQYKIEVKRERLNSSGSVCSLNAEVNGSSPSGFHPPGNQESSKNLEAPVRVRVVALSQWGLSRNRTTSGDGFISPPLHESSPIMRNCSDAQTKNSRGRTRRKHASNGWLQRVEVSTYCGPHRRLWMGPQFSFGVYTYTGHASAELVSPNDKNHSSHVFTTAQKCCPVLIEKNSNVGILRCDTSDSSRIVCGSWTSDPFLFGDDPLATLKEQLEDAMKDHNGILKNGIDGKRRTRKISSTPSSSPSSK